MGSVFPSCDIAGLLGHEREVRAGLLARVAEDREAAESVRESRAASAMQVLNEDRCPSEGGRGSRVGCVFPGERSCGISL